jgi:hypothetical protein
MPGCALVPHFGNFLRKIGDGKKSTKQPKGYRGGIVKPSGKILPMMGSGSSSPLL